MEHAELCFQALGGITWNAESEQITFGVQLLRQSLEPLDRRRRIKIRKGFCRKSCAVADRPQDPIHLVDTLHF
jgi:hypothetical protein